VREKKPSGKMEEDGGKKQRTLFDQIALLRQTEQKIPSNRGGKKSELNIRESSKGPTSPLGWGGVLKRRGNRKKK